MEAHPLGWQTIQARVEPYFGQNWKFSSEKTKQGFFAVGFSQAFSQFFPLTLNERVEGTCKMHYLALLIDDQLEKMSLSDMLSYRERVIRIARGEESSNRDVCIEWMLSNTLQLMRSIDEVLTNDLVEGFCTLLRAMTAQERLSIAHLGPYLAAREVDVGRPFYSALIRYGAKLHLSSSELAQTAALESCAFRFMGVLNDVYSWDREWKVYQEDPTDGAQPFSAVYILAKETELSFAACKRLLYSYCRELEIILKQSAEEIERQNEGTLRPDMAKYIKGLEYLMSGVEHWSQWTPRYR
ncbi:Aristolochene synthase [Penicillium rolfsii]|nr:Aristolochene synthase [Penicillium rolfsii]